MHFCVIGSADATFSVDSQGKDKLNNNDTSSDGVGERAEAGEKNRIINQQSNSSRLGVKSCLSSGVDVGQENWSSCSSLPWPVSNS